MHFIAYSFVDKVGPNGKDVDRNYNPDMIAMQIVHLWHWLYLELLPSKCLELIRPDSGT